MKLFFGMAAICLGSAIAPLAWSYDATLAKRFAELFSEVRGAESGKALHFISAEDFIRDVRAGKDIVTLDVRSEAETGVFAFTLPNSLAIPVNQVFEVDNLDRIPTGKPVIVVCKSGARATAVGTSLRHIGFDNVYILSGGIQGLSSYYGTTQAYDRNLSSGD